MASRSRSLTLAVGAGLAVLAAGACALTGGTLGGREKCWPESEQRLPSAWRGTFHVDASGGRLDTPEGDVIRLLSGALTPRKRLDGFGELMRGNDVVAEEGDDITLFGGAGSDGALVVCAVEENRGQ